MQEQRSRRRTWTVALVTALVTAVAGLAHVPAAATQVSDPVTCRRELRITLNPPLTFTERRHTFDEKGVFASCSNGLEGAMEFTGGTFLGSCRGGHAESEDGVIEWSDGTTSVQSAQADVVVPPFFTLVGEITEGRFAGRSTRSHGYLVPQDPQSCLTSGVTNIEVFGEWTFE